MTTNLGTTFLVKQNEGSTGHHGIVKIHTTGQSHIGVLSILVIPSTPSCVSFILTLLACGVFKQYVACSFYAPSDRNLIILAGSVLCSIQQLNWMFAAAVFPLPANSLYSVLIAVSEKEWCGFGSVLDFMAWVLDWNWKKASRWVERIKKIWAAISGLFSSSLPLFFSPILSYFFLPHRWVVTFILSVSPLQSTAPLRLERERERELAALRHFFSPDSLSAPR